jgi:hypothetical protein
VPSYSYFVHTRWNCLLANNRIDNQTAKFQQISKFYNSSIGGFGDTSPTQECDSLFWKRVMNPWNLLVDFNTPLERRDLIGCFRDASWNFETRIEAMDCIGWFRDASWTPGFDWWILETRLERRDLISCYRDASWNFETRVEAMDRIGWFRDASW